MASAGFALLDFLLQHRATPALSQRSDALDRHAHRLRRPWRVQLDALRFGVLRRGVVRIQPHLARARLPNRYFGWSNMVVLGEASAGC